MVLNLLEDCIMKNELETLKFGYEVDEEEDKDKDWKDEEEEEEEDSEE